MAAGSRWRAVRGAVLGVALVALAGGCGPGLTPASGEVVTERVNLTGVDDVAVGSGFEVTVRRGDDAQMRLHVDDALADHVEVDVSRDRARVRVRGGWWRTWGRTTREIELEVPQLARLEASGGTRVDLVDDVAAGSMVLSLSGGSRVQGAASPDDLHVNGSGGARADLDGEVDQLGSRASGGARLDLSDLRAEDCDVNTSGGARLEVHCTGSLDAVASGGSRIRFTGDPAMTTDVSGGAQVSR